MENNKHKYDTTVIVAVYNNFTWLRLILDALRMQTVGDFEVVIADDGSSEQTVAEIREYIAAHPELPITHAWQPDEGWRKNKCLNNAVRHSSGEYLVFIDGDCIPHPRFVEDHRRLRRHGVVTGGRRVDATPGLTAIIESWSALPENYFDVVRRYMVGHIFGEESKAARKQLKRVVRFPYIFGKPLGAKPKCFIGANFGLYRNDLEKVNGFDERYIEPATGEDSDLDVRLENAGVRHVKYSRYALMIHRNHPRLPFDSKNNAELYKAAVENKLSYIPTGLHQE